MLAQMNEEQNMSSTHAFTSVPAVHYREAARANRAKIDRELLIAGAFFTALLIAGTALFFAVAPRIADIAALYGFTT
jgi:hypothetical protein